MRYERSYIFLCEPQHGDGTERGVKNQMDPKLNVIWGARAIGKVINANERQAFHLLETGAIPAKKVGGQWTAEENQLREFWTAKDKSEVPA